MKLLRLAALNPRDRHPTLRRRRYQQAELHSNPAIRPATLAVQFLPNRHTGAIPGPRRITCLRRPKVASNLGHPAIAIGGPIHCGDFGHLVGKGTIYAASVNAVDPDHQNGVTLVDNTGTEYQSLQTWVNPPGQWVDEPGFPRTIGITFPGATPYNGALSIAGYKKVATHETVMSYFVGNDNVPKCGINVKFTVLDDNGGIADEFEYDARAVKPCKGVITLLPA